jgi:uroporphyrinogen III methyltransferase/synthase
VTEVTVYRTARPETRLDALRSRLERDEIDLVTFTSSSTVIHFLEMLGLEEEPALPESLLRRIRGACIGPTTSRTARERGIEVAAEPGPGDIAIPGLVRAICDYFRDRPAHREVEA